MLTWSTFSAARLINSSECSLRLLVLLLAAILVGSIRIVASNCLKKNLIRADGRHDRGGHLGGDVVLTWQQVGRYLSWD